MKLYLEIKADTNDADYVQQRTEITEQEVEDFKPLIKAIKNKKSGYNWPDFGYTRKDEPTPVEVYSEFGELVEYFSEYVPHGEYGVHTIDSIKLLKVLEEVDLL